VNERVLFTTVLWIAVAGMIVTLLCLIASGAADDPEALMTYLWCDTILLSASMLSLALLRGRKE
jgi:hypothetical protein